MEKGFDVQPWQELRYEGLKARKGDVCKGVKKQWALPMRFQKNDPELTEDLQKSYKNSTEFHMRSTRAFHSTMVKTKKLTLLQY